MASLMDGCLPRFQYPIYNPGDIMDKFLIYNIPQIIDGIICLRLPGSTSHSTTGGNELTRVRGVR